MSKLQNPDNKMVFTGPKNPKDLDPMCIGDNPREYALSSQGYLMPCCWVVDSNEDIFKDLIKDKFHISNTKNIKEIIESDEWKTFADTLVNKPQKASAVCWALCGNRTHKKQKHKY